MIFLRRRLVLLPPLALGTECSFRFKQSVCGEKAFSFSASSQIRYQLADVFPLGLGNERTLAQAALALLAFGRQQMALEAFAALDLPFAGDAQAFHRAAAAFDLRHFVSSFVRPAASVRAASPCFFLPAAAGCRVSRCPAPGRQRS